MNIEHTDFLGNIMELLRYYKKVLKIYLRDYLVKFEIDRTIITYLLTIKAIQ